MQGQKRLFTAVIISYVCLGFMVVAGVVYTRYAIEQNNKLSCGTLEIIVERTRRNPELQDLSRVYQRLYSDYHCEDSVGPVPRSQVGSLQYRYQSTNNVHAVAR